MKKTLLCIATAMLFSITCVIGQTVIGFHTDARGRLLDDNGNEFIPRGFNTPLHWFPDDVPYHISSLRNNVNANALRIVISDGSNGYGRGETPEALWKSTVDSCIKYHIVPMLEIHDYTDSDSPSDLNKAAQWFANHAAYFNQPEIKKHILINIANEWSSDGVAKSDANLGTTVWLDAYKDAIAIIRNAGITTTLVIDAPGYAQDRYNAQVIREDGPLLIEHDGQLLGGPGNLMYSLHMYCLWAPNFNDGPSDPAVMDTIKNQLGIPLMVGEFGDDHPGAAPSGTCAIDEEYIIDQAEIAGVGWFAWSHKGDDVGLDLCNDWACTDLTDWGQTAVNHPDGTNSSVTATAFTTTNRNPFVSITYPGDGDSFEEPFLLTLTADATDDDGTVSQVEFFNGTTSLGVDTDPPFSIDFTNPPVGTHTLTAVATDNETGTTESYPVTITITPIECPTVALGEDQHLCDGSTLMLASGATTEGTSFAWERNGSSISGSSSSLEVLLAGTYQVTASKERCDDVTDEVIIAPADLVAGNDELCIEGEATLTVSGGTGGVYNWYEEENSDDVIHTGSTYEPYVTSTTTFYAQEEVTVNNTVVETIGIVEPFGNVFGNNSFNSDDKQIKITVASEITFDAVSVYARNSGNAITINVTDSVTNQVVSTTTLTNVPLGKNRVPMGVTLSPGTYFVDAVGTTTDFDFMDNSSPEAFPFSIPGYATLTIRNVWTSPTRYGSFFAWEFSYDETLTTLTCSRTAVTATVDPNAGGCVIASKEVFEVSEISVFPNPAQDRVTIDGEFSGDWYMTNLVGDLVARGNTPTVDLSTLASGVYSLYVDHQTVKIVKQ